MNLPQFEKQDKEELSMMEVAVAVLEQKGDVMYFNDLLKEVTDYLGFSDDQVDANIAQFYTDINSRGNFISPIDGMWGLREWYPIDSINEELTFKNDESDVHSQIANDGFDEYIVEDEEEELLEPKLPDLEEDEEEKEDNELGEYEEDLEELAIDDEDEEEDEFEDLTITDEDDLED